MIITSFSDLKKDRTFQLLNQLQSKLAQTDDALLNAPFTRSPFQLISFLIAYAGLDASKRNEVVEKLKGQFGLTQLSKENLDQLINDINWTAILKQDSTKNLQFQFKIELGAEDTFIQAVQKNCPHLHEALARKDKIVIIGTANEVKFTTTIVQTEEWIEQFDRPSGKDYWVVRHFTLSDSLRDKITAMHEKELRIGGFEVQKGEQEDSFVLRIQAPKTSNEFVSDVIALKVKGGIYKVFQGMHDFYGLPTVHKVVVELTNCARFSDIGAQASQTEVATYTYESIPYPSKETIITVQEPLNVYFHGMDVLTCFDCNEEKSSNGSLKEGENDIYIQLTSKHQAESQTGIALFPYKSSQPIQLHSEAVEKLNLRAALQQPVPKADYSFFLRAGYYFSGITSVTALTIAALALASIIELSTAGLATFLAVGVISALATYGLYKLNKKQETILFQEENMMSINVTPQVGAPA